MEAGLSSLGVGVPPPRASWGTLLNDGYVNLGRSVWEVVFPAGVLAMATLGFTSPDNSVRAYYNGSGESGASGYLLLECAKKGPKLFDPTPHLGKHGSTYAFIAALAIAAGVGWIARTQVDEARLADRDKLIAARDKADADKSTLESRLQAAQATIAEREAEIKKRIDPVEFDQMRQAALRWQQETQKYAAEVQRLTTPPQILNTPVSESFFDSGPWCPWRSTHGPCFNLIIKGYLGPNYKIDNYGIDVKSNVLNTSLYTNSNRNRASFFYMDQYYELHVKQVQSKYPVQVEIVAKQRQNLQ